MRLVSVLIKPAGGLCNLQCRYCFYADETARRLFGKESRRWQSLNFFVRLADELSVNKCSIGWSIQTNWLLLDETWQAFLAYNASA